MINVMQGSLLLLLYQIERNEDKMIDTRFNMVGKPVGCSRTAKPNGVLK
jgi:hypothetical protein